MSKMTKRVASLALEAFTLNTMNAEGVIDAITAHLLSEIREAQARAEESEAKANEEAYREWYRDEFGY